MYFQKHAGTDCPDFPPGGGWIGKAVDTMNDLINKLLKESLRNQKWLLALCALLLLPLTFSGCSREDRKPELTPEILTSAPHATNLRKYTVPEGMSTYIDLPAMAEARESGDSQLMDVDRVFVLGEEPADLSPSFKAQNGEVMVVYRNIADNDRSFLIYQYPSLEPAALLEDQAVFYSTEEIAGEPFHILDQAVQDPDQEAYAIREGWLIHLRAIGFTEEEFRDALADLTARALN